MESRLIFIIFMLVRWIEVVFVFLIVVVILLWLGVCAFLDHHCFIIVIVYRRYDILDFLLFLFANAPPRKFRGVGCRRIKTREDGRP